MTGREPLRVGFCVSGGGRLFRDAAEHAELLGIEPAALLLDRRAAEDLEGFAETRGIACRRLQEPDRRAQDAEMIAAFDASDAYLWMLTFDKILPRSVVTPRPGRIVNVHMALLPAFIGMHGLRQALRGGARFAGATIHEVDEQMDHGPTVAQCVLALRRNDDEETAGRRLWPLLRAMYLQVLAWYAAGRVERDDSGQLWVRDGRYAALPVCPAVEIEVLRKFCP